MIVKTELPRSTPEQQGIDSAAILRFVEALESKIHEPHSFMLLRHGSVVAEGWWSPYAAEHAHLMYSVSKSFTATAVGLAVSEGYFSIDDKVVSFFPDDAPDEVSAWLASMRVRDLLTMTAGHAEDTQAFMLAHSSGNWIKGFFDAPLVHAPGTHFVYSNGSTYMLSAIVQKTTGVGLLDYLQPRLFAPLGIEGAQWERSPQGIAIGAYGLSIKTEDLARFGQLYLQRGRWGDQQLVPEAWIEAATTAQVSNGDVAMQSDWTQGYGYQFWRCQHGAYQASGVFGQTCIVMPEQDAVLASTSGVDIFEVQDLLNVVWYHLLPALGNEPLAEGSTAQVKLAEKLASLSMPVAQGGTTSPIAAEVSGRRFEVESNTLRIAAMALDFAADGCTIKITTAAGEERIACGYGAWQYGETSLFALPFATADAWKIATSGAWTSDEIFTMIVRLYETPFFHTFVFYFMGNELMLETRVNATFESLEPVLLTAHPV
jgi:CubicO group peptidase (beta-lactamase class C family)